MNIKKPFFIMLLGCLLFAARPAMAQERIIHNPPENVQAGDQVEIRCRIEALTGSVTLSRLFYRHSREQQYKFVFLNEEDGEWRAVIPADQVRGNKLQYFIAFRLDDDRIITFPENDGQFSPEEIYIVEQNDVSPPVSASRQSDTAALQILAPLADQIFESDDVLIAISVSPQEIDSDSVTIFLNSRDVTSFAIKSDYVLTYEPDNLGPGTHRLFVTAIAKNSVRIEPIQLTFFIKDQLAKEAPTKTQFTGRVFSEARYESIYNRNESFTMGGAEFNGRYNNLDIRGRLFLTSLEDGAHQPRHRFSLAVEHKNFAVEAGDIYPRYNDLMIWGKRVRGISGGVKAGVFEFDAVFGQTYRGVDGSRFVTANNDTLVQNGAFSQNLIGLRPGLNFRHVNIGLSMLKIKDDAGSITLGSRPKDNIVFGPDFLLSLDNGRVELRAHAAYSLLTYDTSIGAFSKVDIENMFSTSVDVPLDPANYQGLLIINDTTVPLNPQEATSLAFDINLKLNYYRNLVRFGYKSIGSDYFSLANSWMRKDIRGFYFSDRVRLFQNKLYFTLGLQRYTDNYSQNGVKPSTDLNTLNFTLSYYPGRGLPNLSVSFRNYNRINGITDIQIDSLTFIGSLDTTDIREDSRQRDINIQLGYEINFMNADHYFTIGYVAAIKNDNFSGSRLPGFFSQEMNSNVNMLTWSSTYALPLRTTVSLATNNNVLGDGISDFHYNAVSLFGEYKFFRNKLAAFGEYRYTQTNGLSYSGAKIDALRNHIRAGAVLYLPAQQTITFESYFITYSSDVSNTLVESPYTDSILRLGYEKFF